MVVLEAGVATVLQPVLQRVAAGLQSLSPYPHDAAVAAAVVFTDITVAIATAVVLATPPR